MTEQQGFATHIVDLIDNGGLSLKADAESRADFAAKGGSAFSYFKKDRECRLSCYLAPDDFFEDDLAGLR